MKSDKNPDDAVILSCIVGDEVFRVQPIMGTKRARYVKISYNSDVIGIIQITWKIKYT